MVLKSFIQYLINKYLKNYIERLDFEKLKVNFTNGKILLENLRLKPEALAYLNIPVTVAVGYIEKLKMTIPWNSLSHNPTEVHIDGLYLLIVPKNEMFKDMTDHYAEKSKRVQQKLNNLRKATADSATIDSKDMAFVQRMKFQMMKNVIFTIRNLHISYEMRSPTKLGHPFSFGITLHYLEITSVNEKQQMKHNRLLVYKVKDVKSLSFYWNTKCNSRLEMSFEDVVKDLQSKILTTNNNNKSYENEMKYIFRPTDFVSESWITLKPKEHQYERSLLAFNISIPQVYVDFDPEQISDILDFIKHQNYTRIYDRCREYRELLLQKSLNASTLTHEQIRRIEFLESKLDIFHLAYIRRKVEIEIAHLTLMAETTGPNEEQQCSILNEPKGQTDGPNKHQQRWHSWSKFKNSFSHRTKQPNPKKDVKITDIGTDHFMAFEDLPKIDFQMNIDKFNLNILSPSTNKTFIAHRRNGDTIANIIIEDAQIQLKRMCITSRIEFSVELRTLYIYGIQREKQHQSIIAMPIVSSTLYPLVHIEMELFSDSHKFDYRLQLIVEPIRFIYDAPTISQLIEYFEANGPAIWQAETNDQVVALDDEQSLSFMKMFDMSINLKGASIILPECGVYNRSFSKIFIKFGSLMLRSYVDADESSNDRTLISEHSKEERLYRKYKLELCDLRMIYMNHLHHRLNILQRIPLIDIDFYKCIYLNHPSLVNWRIGLKLVMGDIRLSRSLLKKVITHLKSIPMFYSNIITFICRTNYYFSLISPNATFISNISIYSFCIRLLQFPQLSVRTDFDIYITKTNDETSTDQNVVAVINDLSMIQHVHSHRKSISRIFYQNDQIKLLYSTCETKF